jgi:hypothetical protein
VNRAAALHHVRNSAGPDSSLDSWTGISTAAAGLSEPAAHVSRRATCFMMAEVGLPPITPADAPQRATRLRNRAIRTRRCCAACRTVNRSETAAEIVNLAMSSGGGAQIAEGRSC